MSSDSPPRSIASLENATERQIREIGGAVPLHQIEGRGLIRAAERFDLLAVAPLLQPWSNQGDAWAARHWPWAAYACYQWLFQHGFRAKHPPPELRPTDVKDALKRIEKNTGAILEDLALLQRATLNVSPAAQNQPGHVSWLLSFIGLYQDYDFAGEQALSAGFSETEVATAMFLQSGLKDRLARLEAAAGMAEQVADPSMLTKVKSGADPMLPPFVSLLANVWTSLTGRPASVAKVHRTDETRPDFVIFCQGLAALAIADADPAARPPMPTHDMIATASRA